MSIRWRRSGELLDADMHKEEPDDFFIDNRLEWQLAVYSSAIIKDIDFENNGIWYWCNGNESFRAVRHPDIMVSKRGWE